MMSQDSNPRSILVRAPNWVGDQILAYPFFHFLRRAYPSARIISACVPWVESLQFRNLIDDVVVLPKPVRPTFSARFEAVEAAARQLRARGPWDLAFSLPDSFSSAWLLYRTGAALRTGYAGDGRSLLLTRRVKRRRNEITHRSQAYVDLLPEGAKPARPAQEFWGLPPDDDLDPGVPGVIPGFEPQSAWPEHEPLAVPARLLEKGYWVLAPGSTAESRRWPLEHVIALARRIGAETGLTGVIVGGPAEAAIADRLCEDSSLKLKDLTAQGSVASLWKVFRQARFTVSNDSGLAHVAALCGSPVQVIWGAGVPQRTKPIGPGKVTITLNPVECWPCERNSCSLGPGRKLECLRGVEPETVWKEIHAGILSAPSPSARN